MGFARAYRRPVGLAGAYRQSVGFAGAVATDLSPMEGRPTAGGGLRCLKVSTELVELHEGATDSKWKFSLGLRRVGWGYSVQKRCFFRHFFDFYKDFENNFYLMVSYS